MLARRVCVRERERERKGWMGREERRGKSKLTSALSYLIAGTVSKKQPTFTPHECRRNPFRPITHTASKKPTQNISLSLSLSLSFTLSLSLTLSLPPSLSLSCSLARSLAALVGREWKDRTNMEGQRDREGGAFRNDASHIRQRRVACGATASPRRSREMGECERGIWQCAHRSSGYAGLNGE